MKIEWTGRGVEIPARLRARGTRQLAKIERYLRGPSEAHIVLSAEGPHDGGERQVAEIVLSTKLGSFTAKDESRELLESLTLALERLDKQVRRARQKALDSRRRTEPDAPGDGDSDSISSLV